MGESRLRLYLDRIFCRLAGRRRVLILEFESAVRRSAVYVIYLWSLVVIREEGGRRMMRLWEIFNIALGDQKKERKKGRKRRIRVSRAFVVTLVEFHLDVRKVGWSKEYFSRCRSRIVFVQTGHLRGN